MKNLPKEKRDRLVLVSLSTVMVLIALWQGVINLQRKGLVNLNQRLGEEKNKLANAERLVNSVETFRQDIKEKSADLKELESGMASGDMYSWIVMKLNQFKVGYNVEIPQISREIPMTVAIIPNFPYKAALFNIRGKAYYHDFGRFLADFENAFPYLRVQNIKLEPAGTSSAAVGTVGAEQPEEAEKSEKLSFQMEIVTLVNPIAQ